MNKQLTDAERELMEILWEKKSAFMKEILDCLPEPKPAPSTVATLLKRMQKKNLISYKVFGNSREYYPNVAKENYFNQEMTKMIDRFFNSSVSQFASYFANHKKLTQDQLKELRQLIDEQIKD